MHDPMTLEIDTLNDLYSLYMPFLVNGGLFYPCRDELQLGTKIRLSVLLPDALDAVDTEVTVAWVSPNSNQTNKPQGVGLAFTEQDSGLRDTIEKLLATKLKSTDPTFTM